ncbi:unnamed protein product [Lactuca saligna]|uniref:Retrotransposon gag domain-containing protein n=1 Tax=Lactuca saligna TaxID=75948 RepID=A0AA35Y8Y9_LACSI|nr:unnamed protein product [Lactuca saligna]
MNLVPVEQRIDAAEEGWEGVKSALTDLQQLMNNQCSLLAEKMTEMAAENKRVCSIFSENRGKHNSYRLPSPPPPPEVETKKSFYTYEDEEMMKVAVRSLEGDALLFYEWEHRRRPIRDWEELKGLIRRRFKSSNDAAEHILANSEFGSLEYSDHDSSKNAVPFPGGPKLPSEELEMPLFDGNQSDWILEAEWYFSFYGLREEDKLDVAVMALQGDALLWYEWEHRRRSIKD